MEWEDLLSNIIFYNEIGGFTEELIRAFSDV